MVCRAPAGGVQHVPEQVRIGVPEPERVLRAAAGGGEEGAFGMDARDEPLGRQRLEHAECPHQLVAGAVTRLASRVVVPLRCRKSTASRQARSSPVGNPPPAAPWQ